MQDSRQPDWDGLVRASPTATDVESLPFFNEAEPSQSAERPGNGLKQVLLTVEPATCAQASLKELLTLSSLA